MNEHDREVAAEAWDACVAALIYDNGTPVEVVVNDNPYRESRPCCPDRGSRP